VFCTVLKVTDVLLCTVLYAGLGSCPFIRLHCIFYLLQCVRNTARLGTLSSHCRKHCVCSWSVVSFW